MGLLRKADYVMFLFYGANEMHRLRNISDGSRNETAFSMRGTADGRKSSVSMKQMISPWIDLVKVTTFRLISPVRPRFFVRA